MDSVKDPEVRSLLDEFVPNLDSRDLAEHLPHLVEREAKQIQRFARYQCWIEPDDDAKTIAGYVSELVNDGSTLQIGTGTPTRFLATVGAFDDKKDLGWHSEMGIPGIIDLIERGVITGAKKNLHKDKAIFGALLGAFYRELDYAHENPLIEQLDVEYVARATTVAQNDNMVSINNALSVDLTGQINAETVFGGRLMSGTGGQFDFQMGAIMSKGGSGDNAAPVHGPRGHSLEDRGPARGRDHHQRPPHLRRHHHHRIRRRATPRQVQPREGSGANLHSPPRLPGGTDSGGGGVVLPVAPPPPVIPGSESGIHPAVRGCSFGRSQPAFML